MNNVRNKLNSLGGRWSKNNKYWYHSSGLVGVTIDDNKAYICQSSSDCSRKYANLLLMVLDIIEDSPSMCE